jgi:peptidoglycan-associated lipoprotein
VLLFKELIFGVVSADRVLRLDGSLREEGPRKESLCTNLFGRKVIIMRSLKVLAVCLLAVVSTGCSCRTATTDGNIGTASSDGPLKDIYFAFDSYKIDATAKSTLAANAEWLKAHEGTAVQVEGHCDERGTNEYNMVLGANRARAAADQLRSMGIPAKSISTVSYGEELPVDPGHNEEAWAKNRRAHFKVN